MVYPLVYPAIVTEYGVDDHYYQVQEYNGKIVGFWNNFLDALGIVGCFVLDFI